MQAFPLIPHPAQQPATPSPSPATTTAGDTGALQGHHQAGGADPAMEPPSLPEPPGMILQLDFCKLKGSRSLGSLTARLKLRRWGAAAVQYEAVIAGDVDVRAYGADGGVEASEGLWQMEGQGSHGEEGTEQGDEGEERGSDGGGIVDAGAEVSKATGQETGGVVAVVEQQEQQPVGGANGSGSGVDSGGDGAGDSGGSNSGGDHGRELLEQLASSDEVMVDLALFDDRGRLLVGR